MIPEMRPAHQTYKPKVHQSVEFARQQRDIRLCSQTYGDVCASLFTGTQISFYVYLSLSVAVSLCSRMSRLQTYGYRQQTYGYRLAKPYVCSRMSVAVCLATKPYVSLLPREFGETYGFVARHTARHTALQRDIRLQRDSGTRKKRFMYM